MYRMAIKANDGKPGSARITKHIRAAQPFFAHVEATVRGETFYSLCYSDMVTIYEHKFIERRY